MNYVISELRERIAYIVLNRPEKRNALNAQFVEELKQTITKAEHDSEVRAIVLKSSSEAFCAGADLAYLQQLQGYSFDENLQDSKNLAALFKMMYGSSKPIISMINGPALAGGCGLATVCDMCFSTPESTFGYTEARIGFIPAIVMVFLRKKVGETLAKKMLFTGEVFSADKAFEYGLLTEIVKADELETYVHEFVKKLIEHSSGGSLTMIKQMYNNLDNLSLDDALNYACEMNAKTRESEDCKRGIAAFLNKQKLKW